MCHYKLTKLWCILWIYFRADSQQQGNHFTYVNRSELHISVTVKVEQHGEGFKADLDKSAICNIMKCKSQGQGESNQDNGHITVDIGEQEVIPRWVNLYSKKDCKRKVSIEICDKH